MGHDWVKPKLFVSTGKGVSDAMGYWRARAGYFEPTNPQRCRFGFEFGDDRVNPKRALRIGLT